MRTIWATGAVACWSGSHETRRTEHQCIVGGFSGSQSGIYARCHCLRTHTQRAGAKAVTTKTDVPIRLFCPGPKAPADLPGFKTQSLTWSAVKAPQTINCTLQVAPRAPPRSHGGGDRLIAESRRQSEISSPRRKSALPMVSTTSRSDATRRAVRGTDLTKIRLSPASAPQWSIRQRGLTFRTGVCEGSARSPCGIPIWGESGDSSPVDAELGRGNGQVQILTKSGTNQIHGSAFWTVRNSKLDANTWTNNKQVVNGVWSPTTPPWLNRHDLTGTVGGPIMKNKTFFFVLRKAVRNERQTSVRTRVPIARSVEFYVMVGLTPGI